jgi:hypothetical protein
VEWLKVKVLSLSPSSTKKKIIIMMWNNKQKCLYLGCSHGSSGRMSALQVWDSEFKAQYRKKKSLFIKEVAHVKKDFRWIFLQDEYVSFIAYPVILYHIFYHWSNVVTTYSLRESKRFIICQFIQPNLSEWREVLRKEKPVSSAGTQMSLKKFLHTD